VERSEYILDASQLGVLLEALADAGYEVLGPRLRDGALVYDPIESADDLPTGWSDEQQPGSYRLKRRDDGAFFGYTLGPQSWKKYTHPAEVRLWSAERHDSTFRILNNETTPEKPRAFLGVRACELKAIAVQERVLLEDKYRDLIYERNRRGTFIVAVQCTQSAPTCFCASLGTGPQVTGGFDLVLTELLDSGKHRFLLAAESNRGAEILTDLKLAPATDEDRQQAATLVDKAA